MDTFTERYEDFETVVVGGGQAGLAVGYELKRRGRSFVILDASPRVGDAWRRRWDSLVLFTTARYCGLPGLRVPARGGSYITKDQMADYLESYARHFELPVRTSTRVNRVSRVGDRFRVETDGTTFEADNVVVAMANFQQPKLPKFAAKLDPRIVQLHSHDYKNPGQLVDGPTLVVGVGNSGADIALEIAETHPTWLAGKESAVIPFRIETFVARNVLLRGVRFVGHHVLTLRTPIGRKVRPAFVTRATPLIRVKPKDLLDAGITRVARIVDVRDGLPVSDDGQTIEVSNVVWCTGYRPGFSWIDLPVMGDRQEPEQERGIVTGQPGLYFVGLEFTYGATSATITGVGRDARRVARHLTRRSRGAGLPVPADVVAASMV
ncbi:MAG TPA: NAD(P)/FAD-dependent oxidoreductase [Acidimicrobiia bacterium]|jgi:putative flavoprotein involved in K+ transport